jgi:hypothetical protein
VQEKRLQKKGEITNMEMDKDDDLLPEYNLDYSKARPNRFAKEYNEMTRRVSLDSDIADYFPTAESVNDALRSLVQIANKNQSKLVSK